MFWQKSSTAQLESSLYYKIDCLIMRLQSFCVLLLLHNVSYKPQTIEKHKILKGYLVLIWIVCLLLEPEN